MNRRLHTPNSYELRVDGHLDEHGSTWFDEMSRIREDDGTTGLRGLVTDRAALRGLLAKVANRGITVISVEAIDTPH